MRFGQVTHATLTLDGEKIPESIKFLSTLIDISKLKHISLCLTTIPKISVKIGILLEQAHNVRSLGIQSSWKWNDYFNNMKEICLILPKHIQHLRVDICSIEQMKEVFERIKYVSSVTFQSVGWERVIKCFDNFLLWLTERGMDFSSVTTGNELHIWLGKTVRKDDEILHTNKLLKISQ